MIVDTISAMPPPGFHHSAPMPETMPPTNAATNEMPMATSPTR